MLSSLSLSRLVEATCQYNEAQNEIDKSVHLVDHKRND